MGSGLEALVGPEGGAFPGPSVAPPLPRIAVGGLGGGGLGQKGDRGAGHPKEGLAAVVGSLAGDL